MRPCRRRLRRPSRIVFTILVENTPEEVVIVIDGQEAMTFYY
jgi:hypothetical protein